MSALKARREALGLSVTQLARLCGCSESLIYYAENGRVIHPKFADRIAEKLKLSTEERDALVAPKHRSDAPPPEPETADPLRKPGAIGGRGIGRRPKPAKAPAEARKVPAEARKVPAEAAKVPDEGAEMLKADEEDKPIGGKAVAKRLREDSELLDGCADMVAKLGGGLRRFEESLRLLAEDLRRIVGDEGATPSTAGARPAPLGAGKKRRGKWGRGVVKLNADGAELGRWEGAKEAAEAAGMSERSVPDRCRRRIEREFMRYGGAVRAETCTWRWAGEWDAMSPEERRADMKGEYGR